MADVKNSVNPMVSQSSVDLEPNADRDTTISRFDSDDSVRYVRSVPDTILMSKSVSSTVWIVAYGLTFLQLVVSILITTSECSTKVVGHPSYENIVTYIAASLAVATSINNSTLELWINNECLERLKKSSGTDELMQSKDFLITLYVVGQFALIVATIVSISQQGDPVGIITNCTGLLLVQNLDQGVFSCMKFEAKGSHEFKQQLREVSQDPKFSSSRKYFISCFIFLYIVILSVSIYYAA